MPRSWSCLLLSLPLLVPVLAPSAVVAQTVGAAPEEPAQEPPAGALAATGKWLLFPDTPLYPPYLADPHRIAFAMELMNVDSGIAETGSERFGLRVGGDFGVLRSRPKSPHGRIWQFNFLGSLNAEFDIEESLDNVGWDGNFGTGVVTARRGSPWSFKLALFHTSAHRGDEYVERTGRGRVGYTREEVQVGLQRAFGERWRGYLEGAWAFTNNADDGSQEPARAQAGWVFEAPRTLWGGRLGWYWGVDVSGWEERDWRLDSAFQIGLSLPTDGNVWRLALSVADGRPPMGEFFQDTESWVAVGIWLDL